MFSCLFLLLFVSLPQENDLNDMLNSLYDLPVPKPYTPVNLSVVGIDLLFSLIRGKTDVSRGREGQVGCCSSELPQEGGCRKREEVIMVFQSILKYSGRHLRRIV